jgi:hypothetical protein
MEGGEETTQERAVTLSSISHSVVKEVKMTPPSEVGQTLVPSFSCSSSRALNDVTQVVRHLQEDIASFFRRIKILSHKTALLSTKEKFHDEMLIKESWPLDHLSLSLSLSPSLFDLSISLISRLFLLQHHFLHLAFA